MRDVTRDFIFARKTRNARKNARKTHAINVMNWTSARNAHANLVNKGPHATRTQRARNSGN